MNSDMMITTIIMRIVVTLCYPLNPITIIITIIIIHHVLLAVVTQRHLQPLMRNDLFSQVPVLSLLIIYNNRMYIWTWNDFQRAVCAIAAGVPMVSCRISNDEGKLERRERGSHLFPPYEQQRQR